MQGLFIYSKKFLQDNYNMTGNEKQVFKDYSKQGKDRKWRERKLKNIELAGRLENWVIVRLNGSINVQRF